jgi:hypothetical protein
MLASVHVADIGIAATPRFLFRAPRVEEVPGLRSGEVALCAPLTGKLRPPSQLGRVSFIGFWDDEAALDAFLASHPTAAALAGGWHARLEPVRRYGDWPGLPELVPTDRAVAIDGPAIVLTLARIKMPEVPRFLRTNAQAEASVLRAPGLAWATGMARPPFIASFSLWDSTRALSTYAYGRGDPRHADSIAENARKGFHHQSAFVRFRPLRVGGHLDGKNPLPQTWADAVGSA